MGLLSYIFGVFGLFAYLECSKLKKKVNGLEKELSQIQGTNYQKSAQSLYTMVQSYIGQPVIIQLKEDYLDGDVLGYGNSKHGSNTILEVDPEWVLVLIKSKKEEKKKLIRLHSIDSISLREQ